MTNEVTRKVVVVLGMHRSGTSAITRGLQVLGVQLGDRLMPAHPEVNAKGFWEDLDFHALNEEMFAALGRTWWTLASISDEDIGFLRESGFEARARELLRAKTATGGVLGIKDPRMSKLLPFWKVVFSDGAFDVYYVLAIRNPMSVARSLEKRDAFEHDRSYVLWLEHVVGALAVARTGRLAVIDYDLLMVQPELQLRKLALLAGLQIDAGELERYRSDFLDHSLRHGNYQLSDLDNGAVPPFVREVYATLLAVAKKEALDSRELVPITGSWERRLADMQVAMRVADRATRLRVAELERENRAQREEIAKRVAWIRETRKELKETREALDAVLASNSWRVTRPLRALRNFMPGFQAFARRGLRGVALAAKRRYLSLPFEAETRARHRQLVAAVFPRLLGVSAPQAYQLRKPRCRPEYDADLYGGEIYVGTSPNPRVSVIIPVYGKIGYTLRCLASIADNLPDVPFEVIVVNDCSPDNSEEVLSRVGGIRVVSNSSNQGFIRSCNAGAHAAVGEYLLFLNNDTEVMPWWLDEMVRTFRVFPGTGLVGSKLIYPDGTLQEAGGIVWQDASAWNFGRNQDPGMPLYNYVREVDFCSGASIMVPRALFTAIGGFDEHYRPAYYEDVDLALKIRKLGYRVLYQPLSEVIHYEGATSGTDTSRGVKAYQIDNQQKLLARWREVLDTYQKNGEDVQVAKDRGVRRRALVIDHCTPTPNQDAGSMITFNMMILLREMGFQVTFIPEDNFFYMAEYTTALQRAGVEALYGPYVTSVERHLREAGGRYDLVVLFRPMVCERYMAMVKSHCPSARVIYHTVDLHFLRMGREAELTGDAAKRREAEQMKRREYEAIREADTTIVVSAVEDELLQRELPGQRVRVFPLIMNIPGTRRRREERRNLVFVGGFQHAPNVDAALYFVKEVMPELNKRLPGVGVTLVGSNPTPEVRALAGGDVTVAGFVDDLPPYLENFRVAIAPLRFGAGIKGKIGTAMSLGLPTVATSIAVEGMALTNGENVVVADGAVAFAEAIARLYEDEELWNKVSAGGVKFADAAWGPEAAWEIQARLLRELGFSIERGDRPLQLYSSGIS